MSAGIAVIVGPLLELLGPALKRFFATTAGLWVAGGVASAMAATVMYGELATLSPVARIAACAVALLAIATAWGVAGTMLSLARAAGLGAEEAIRKFALGRKLGEAAAERLAEFARFAREGTSGPEIAPRPGGAAGAAAGAAAAVGTALATLETLPLVDAEGFLRRAIDSLLGEGLPGEGTGGRIKAAILNRIRLIALRTVEKFLLTEFRKEAGPAGKGGGVDVKKVIGRVAGVADDRVAGIVRAKVRLVTLLAIGGLLLASALPVVAAIAYARHAAGA